MTRTDGERVAALEVEVSALKGEIQEISVKMDSLLELKNKGMGAFWFASAIIGSGIGGFILTLTGWLHGR